MKTRQDRTVSLLLALMLVSRRFSQGVVVWSVRISQPAKARPAWGLSSVSGIPATERPNLSQGSGTWPGKPVSTYPPAPATPSPGFLQTNQAILIPRNYTALVQVRYQHDRVVCCKSLGVSGCFAVVSRWSANYNT